MKLWAYTKLIGRTFTRSLLQSLGGEPKLLAYNNLIHTIDDRYIDDDTAVREFMELAKTKPERWMLTRMLEQFSVARPQALNTLHLLLRV